MAESFVNVARADASIRAQAARLTLNKLKESFYLVCDMIVAHWIPGMYEIVKEKEPRFMREIDAAENELDLVWNLCDRGTGNAAHFYALLKKWAEAHEVAPNWMDINKNHLAKGKKAVPLGYRS